MEENLFQQLKKISFASFVFHLRATTELCLPPYKGSTLRGAFGVVFKDTVCVMDHRDCDRCILKFKCSYPYIFETPIPDESARMHNYPSAPHPFVIEPPLETKTIYECGDPLIFGLTLIGKAVDYLPYFIYAFERLGERWGIGRGRGRFEIDTVTWIDPSGMEKPVYDSKRKVLSNSFHPVTIQELSLCHNPESVTLHYLTPTRITFKGTLHTSPEFHVIIRNLLRRLSNLTYFHCGEELRLNFKGIIEQAKEIGMRNGSVKWHDWERYSARQDTRMKMGGFVGKVEYQGRLGEFIPLLKLGEMVHIGKGTGFGLGRYQIT